MPVLFVGSIFSNSCSTSPSVTGLVKKKNFHSYSDHLNMIQMLKKKVIFFSASLGPTLEIIFIKFIGYFMWISYLIIIVIK